MADKIQGKPIPVSEWDIAVERENIFGAMGKVTASFIKRLEGYGQQANLLRDSVPIAYGYFACKELARVNRKAGEDILAQRYEQEAMWFVNKFLQNGTYEPVLDEGLQDALEPQRSREFDDAE